MNEALMTASEPTAARVQTVLGDIAPDALKLTMMHEHLFGDFGAFFKEPEDPESKALSREKVSFENLWWVRYNFQDSFDNLSLSDVDVAISEATKLVKAGGSTLVDLTPRLSGRSPENLVRVAKETGLNIVMGCGYYVDGTYPEDARVSEKGIDELSADIVRDISVGWGPESIKAGIIGEVGCSWPLTPNEIKVLRAAAQAQSDTGATINVHPGKNEDALYEIAAILDEAGADLTRVVLSHMDRCGYELSTRRRVLDLGCVIEYDLFGLEGYFPARTAQAENTMPDVPNDLERLRQLRTLINMGYKEQLAMSHDICMKFQRTNLGGWGYGHILRNVVPLMTLYGFSPEEVQQLLVATPRRLLTLF